MCEVVGNSLVSFLPHWHRGHASQEGVRTPVQGTDTTPEMMSPLSLVALCVSHVDVVQQGGLLHHDPPAGYPHSLALGTDVICQCS